MSNVCTHTVPSELLLPFSEAAQIWPFLKIAPKLEAHILVSRNMTCCIGMQIALHPGLWETWVSPWSGRMILLVLPHPGGHGVGDLHTHKHKAPSRGAGRKPGQVILSWMCFIIMVRACPPVGCSREKVDDEMADRAFQKRTLRALFRTFFPTLFHIHWYYTCRGLTC